MLTLSRKRDEWVNLLLPDGRTIGVQLTDIRGDRVRLGFEAPRDVKILRRELVKEGAAHE